MQHYTDNVLYKTRQHILILISKILSWFVPYLALILISAEFLFPNRSTTSQILSILLGGATIFAYQYFLWVKSYLLITNEKLVKKVRNGLFSKFHMAIHYDSIRDVAFSKNNILHYMTGAGTLFARSSAAAVGDFEAYWTPHIEKVYKIVNYMHNITPADRKQINDIQMILTGTTAGRDIGNKVSEKIETREQIIEKEKQTLLAIQGIKEVIELTDADRRYIFEKEEDRNHGVYECLRRQVLFAATHDSTLREPDESIVMKAGKKVVFPVVEFHEIKRKKVSSSSPGIEIHNYLTSKFEKLGEYDATLIIGFDI